MSLPTGRRWARHLNARVWHQTILILLHSAIPTLVSSPVSKWISVCQPPLVVAIRPRTDRHDRYGGRYDRHGMPRQPPLRVTRPYRCRRPLHSHRHHAPLRNARDAQVAHSLAASHHLAFVMADGRAQHRACTVLLHHVALLRLTVTRVPSVAVSPSVISPDSHRPYRHHYSPRLQRQQLADY